MSKEDTRDLTVRLPKAFVHAECVRLGPVGEVRLTGTREGFALLRDQLTDFLENEVVPGTHGGFMSERMIPWRFICIERERQVPFQVIEPITEQSMEHTLVEQPVCHLCNGTGEVWVFHDGPMEVCPCREAPPNAPAVMASGTLTPELMQEMCDKFMNGLAFKPPSLESLLFEMDNMARLYRITNKDGCHDEHLAIIAKQRLEMIDTYNEAVASSPSPKEEETDHA
jgi:hypothetical protein